MSRASNIVLLVVSSLLLAPGILCAQEDVESVGRRLVEAGFVNVRSYEDGNVRIFTIQNDRYRIQSQGIAEALRVISSCGIPDSLSCKVIATYYDIPQVTLTYGPSLGTWSTSYRLNDSWKKVRKAEKHNSSLGKIDFVVYPQFSFMNLVITQVYQSIFQISPAVEVSLWPGMKLTGMVQIPVWNDGYSTLDDFVHPSVITVSQRFRDPWNLKMFGKITVGIFSNNRNGVALEMFHPFINEKFSLECKLGYLGLGYWNKFLYHFDVPDEFYWSVTANYWWKAARTNISLSAEKFLYGDKGLRAEVVRHFRYCSIGLYGEKGFLSDAQFNGGFRFSVALPPYRSNRCRSLPRVVLGSMGLSYNANNEQYFYNQYKTEASDNIMEHNGFNPYLIDSELRELLKR